MEEDQGSRVTFKEWCIGHNIPFRDDPDGEGNILVRDEDMVPYYSELMLDFPKYFYREDDSDLIPHAMN